MVRGFLKHLIFTLLSETQLLIIPCPLCRQIIHAEGPSGPNREYLFQLEQALLQMGKVSLRITIFCLSSFIS